jgi:TM2 domain-containing membrane protein YozV
MKPMYLLIVALILVVIVPAPSRAQNPEKKEKKTTVLKKKKLPQSTTAKQTASGSQSSVTKNASSSPPDSQVNAKELQRGSSESRILHEHVQSIVIKDQKSPGLALGLSALLPGGGQYYNGDYVKGIVQTGIFATGIVLALTLGTESSYSSNPYTDYGYYGTYTYYRPTTEEWTSAWMYVGIGVAAGAWLWSVIDAPLSASSHNDMAAQSSYGHMLELNGPSCVVGIDMAALQGGPGLNLAIHF